MAKEEIRVTREKWRQRPLRVGLAVCVVCAEEEARKECGESRERREKTKINNSMKGDSISTERSTCLCV